MQLNNLNYLVNVNVLSNVLNSHFVAKRWPDTTIINLSSLIGGEFPSGYLGIYAGTKAFVKQIH
jgi:short-subunit dehydrogenase